MISDVFVTVDSQIVQIFDMQMGHANVSGMQESALTKNKKNKKIKVLLNFPSDNNFLHYFSAF